MTSEYSFPVALRNGKKIMIIYLYISSPPCFDINNLDTHLHFQISYFVQNSPVLLLCSVQVACALLLAGEKDEAKFEAAKEILVQMGTYFQVQVFST